jgi:1-aminocyclopropane-1-carboxylate deaminase
LKGDGILDEEVGNLLPEPIENKHWSINYQYHFGGYAKIKPELIKFINDFHQKHAIILDPIYTGKMMFGLYDMIAIGSFEIGTTIVALHTGGLQGIKGIEERYGVMLPK